MNTPIIELKDVSVSSENYHILENINLRIAQNEEIAIIGKSGAGKSTLLKLMAGILEPGKGIINIYHQNINSLNDKELIKIKMKMGFVFQEAALISNLNIQENLELALKFRFQNISTQKMNDKIYTMLDKINMTNSLLERPAQLSMGEKKLISIARALLIEPEILFLDEPLASIDATITKKILEITKEYSDIETTTVISVTNLKSLITCIAKRIILIDNKTIIWDGLIDDIRKLSPDQCPQLIYDIFE